MHAVVLRPRRWRQIGAIAAAVIVGVAIVSAATFTGTKAANGGRVDDVTERTALIGLGLVFAGVAWWIRGRPRIRANDSTIEVRNVIGEYTIDWTSVSGIRLPPKGSIGNLELASGEVVGLSAVQRIDAMHAARALTILRNLHTAASTSEETPLKQDPSDDPQRPR